MSSRTASLFEAFKALNTVALLRAVALGGSLIAMTLTFRVLDAEAFTLFNFVTFLIAIAAAIALPLNRAFWAAKSKEAFVPALAGGGLIVAFTLTAGLLLVEFGRDGIALITGAAIAYAVVRVVERYGYSLLLIDGRNLAAGAFLALFALFELVVVGLMWLGGSDVLVVRFGGTALLFGLASLVCFAIGLMPEVRWKAGFGQLKSYVTRNLLTRQGVSFIMLAAVMTFANMAERALMTLVPLDDAQFGAAYLLALSYSVALATFLGFLFDLARVNVYRDGAWQSAASNTLMLYAGVASAVIGAALFSYPALTWIGLIDPEIGWLLWGAFLLRALATMLVNLFNVDHYQSGSPRNIVITDLLLIAVVLSAFFRLHEGASIGEIAAIISAGSALAIGANAWLLSRRLKNLA